MQVVYSHTTPDGRELRVERATHTSDEHPVVIVADAPGERAVSHPFTPLELDSLIATLVPLGSTDLVGADDPAEDTPFRDAPAQADEQPEG